LHKAPDDAAMHQLWQATSGLYGTRHLTLDADTEQARVKDPVPPSTPWAQAPIVDLTATERRLVA
jgi:hypothetical protein